MSSRITVSAVRALGPGTTLWDLDVSGFGVRRQRRDAVYVLKTRVDGRVRWFTIGRHGAPWTPDAARKRALALLGDIARGLDPAAIRDQRKTALTVSELIDRFLEEHVATRLKPRTRAEYRSLLERFVRPRLGDRRVEDLRAADVAALHHAMRETPRQANHMLATTRKMLNWAATRGVRTPETNPCAQVERYPERPRERYLSGEELVALGRALERAAATESPFALAAIRMLLLTGARRNEILGLTWAQVDLERGLLALPDTKTGVHALHLGPEATAVLRDLPRFADNPHVICGARPGRPLVGIGRIWRRIAVDAGLEGVRLHDLRHTFASVAIADGVPLATIGALLGHRRPDTTARYAHLAADPVRAAGARVGALIDGRLGAAPAASWLAAPHPHVEPIGSGSDEEPARTPASPAPRQARDDAASKAPHRKKGKAGE